jgi:hypothetical protein
MYLRQLKENPMNKIITIAFFLAATGAFAEDFSGAESVAAAMAKANYAGAAKVSIDRSRSLGAYDAGAGDKGEIIEVRVKTGENSSAAAVRIYRLREDPTGSIVRATLYGSEGPVGP